MKIENRTIFFATSNKGKLKEANEVAAKFSCSVHGLEDMQKIKNLFPPPQVEEDGNTYEKNVFIKAKAYHSWSGREPTLTDDSGLEVEALKGEPGVNTARYAGVGAGSLENIKKLLTELKSETNRKARFVCCIHFITAKGDYTFRSEFHGRIAESAYGSGGFGYDPVFIPDGYDKTLAQLKEEKIEIKTHRVLALEELFKAWQ